METFWFWTVAIAITVLVCAWLVRGLIRSETDVPPAALQDMQVYRDQLAEADRDLARGTLTEAEAGRVKTEIARRILEADKLSQGESVAPAAKTPWLAMAAILIAMAGGVVLYSRLGVPWYPDLPIRERLAMADTAMANRPSQEAAEATITPQLIEPNDEFRELMEKLRAAVDPATATDLRGLELLAQNETALGNHIAARRAQARLIEVKGADATAEDHVTLAEMMILAAGGYVSPEAETELTRSLERDPKNGLALYFSGLMFAQGGRYDRAFTLWQPLLQQGPENAPWIRPIRAQIEEVAARAGMSYQLPEAGQTALPGPSDADMQAAADMSPEDRQQMIEGMVDGLKQRLATEGGTAEEWARLISALATLGRKDEAKAILGEARGIFADYPNELAFIEAAAIQGGLEQ